MHLSSLSPVSKSLENQKASQGSGSDQKKTQKPIEGNKPSLLDMGVGGKELGEIESQLTSIHRESES